MTGSLNVWPLNPSGVRCLVDWDWVVYGSLHDPGGGSTDSRNCRRHLSCQVFFFVYVIFFEGKMEKRKKKGRCGGDDGAVHGAEEALGLQWGKKGLVNTIH